MRQIALRIAVSSIFSRIATADGPAEKPNDGLPCLILALQPATIILSPWPCHIPPTKRQGVAVNLCLLLGQSLKPCSVVYGIIRRSVPILQCRKQLLLSSQVSCRLIHGNMLET